MLFKKLVTIIFILFSFSKINAQEFKLGKVSIAELQEKEHPKDPAAAAAILFKTGKTTFEYTQNVGFKMVTEVKTRIKIYKKEGYEWANQKVRYYLDNRLTENVSFSDAITYNLVDGKIEKTKLKSDGQFDEKINKFWGQKKITMPNVKEGSVIEFEYTVKSPIIGSIREWSFQASIPVNYSEYTTYIPEYFVYKPNQKGYFFPKVTVEKTQKSVTISEMVREDGSGLLRGQTSTYSQGKFNYEETRTTYTAENLPAMKEEAYVNNIDNYTSSITNELSMTRYPNEPFKTFSTDWETVTKTIYDYDDFGPELNKTGYFEDDLKNVLVGLKTQDDMIAAVFSYVKSSVKWNNYYGYFCNDGVRKAYKDKTGNVAEINLMLTAMLRYAGLTANPVLLSTRSNGIALFPNRTAFNYVIAAVETPTGLILLDATEKFSVPNVLPLRDLNWIGRLIRKDKTSIEVDLTPKAVSREAVNMTISLKNSGSADGKIRTQLTNHEALEFRQKNLATNKETYLEELENKNNGIEISDYIRDNDLDLSKSIVETYSFKDTKDIEIVKDKIYISPMLFLTSKENPFKQEVREYPIDFGYPTQNKYNISIDIPEGYVVESMPSPLNIATEENKSTFKYIIGNTDNKIQITITAEINTAIVSSDFYATLKEFFKEMISKQNEKIVLIKI